MAASLEEKAIEFGGTIGITVLGSVLEHFQAFWNQ
jgi:hypothetical protein